MTLFCQREPVNKQSCLCHVAESTLNPNESSPAGLADAQLNLETYMATWNSYGDFTLNNWDSGNISNRNYTASPWGPGAWNVSGRTFLDAFGFLYGQSSYAKPIAGQRYYVRNSQAYLYGREDAGHYGFVRFIQGNVWGSGLHTPAPLPLQDERAVPLLTANSPPTMNMGFRPRTPGVADMRNLRLHLDLRRGHTTLHSSAVARAMYAINMWITGPAFPPGHDGWGRKPLVFDLAFHTEGSGVHGGLRSFQSAGCYHFQEAVGVAPLSRWQSFDIELTPIIRRAMQMFHLPVQNAAICQLEFLMELINAEGSALIDNFYLTY